MEGSFADHSWLWYPLWLIFGVAWIMQFFVEYKHYANTIVNLEMFVFTFQTISYNYQRFILDPDRKTIRKKGESNFKVSLAAWFDHMFMNEDTSDNSKTAE